MIELRLENLEFNEDGIWGTMPINGTIFHTLQHAYANGSGFAPKIPDGEYLCIRGLHRLEHMDYDFETFEITNVPGHTSILVHWGNYNRDSSGCILLGLAIGKQSSGERMLLSSRSGFEAFMNNLDGFDQFKLIVQTGAPITSASSIS